MFWQLQEKEGLTGTLQELLEKENTTLEEILEDPAVLQELRAGDEKLVEFLTRKENILGMISHALVLPPEKPGIEMKERFKHANISSELLASNTDQISRSLFELHEVRQMLWDFPKQKAEEVNPLMASYFLKLITVMLGSTQGNLKVSELITGSETFVEDLLKHIGTSAMAELWQRMYSVPEDCEESLLIKLHLVEKGLVTGLLKVFDPAYPSDYHANSALIWSENVRYLRDILYSADEKNEDELLLSLQSESALGDLLERMLCPAGQSCPSIAEHGASILISLLDSVYISGNPLELAEQAASATPVWRGGAPPEPGSTVGFNANFGFQNTPLGGGTIWTPDPKHVAEASVANRMDDLHNIFQRRIIEGNVEESQKMLLPMGKVRPFGRAALSLVKLIAQLLNMNHASSQSQLARLGTMRLLFKLVTQYPANSFFHHALLRCVNGVLFGRRPPLPYIPKKSIAGGDGPCFDATETLTETNDNPSGQNRLEGEGDSSSASSKINGDNQTGETEPHELLIEATLCGKEDEKNGIGMIELILEQLSTWQTNDVRQVPYRAHIFSMARALQNALLRGPNRPCLLSIFQDKISEDLKEKWDEFVENVLSKYENLNQPDNVDAPSCGEQQLSEEIHPLQGVENRVSSGIRDDFDAEMDATNSEPKITDEIDAMSKGMHLDFKTEEFPEMPAGEADFEALCSKKIGSFSLEGESGDGSEAGKNSKTSRHSPGKMGRKKRSSSSSSDSPDEDFISNHMEIDDPWASNESANKSDSVSTGWADFGDFSSSPAPADSSFPPSDPARPAPESSPWGSVENPWGSSPVSQGIAAATQLESFWTSGNMKAETKPSASSSTK